MSLLTLVQAASRRMGLPVPTAVFASTDQQILEILEYAQTEGKELAEAVPWQALMTERTFTSVAQAVQTGAIPAAAFTSSGVPRIINDSMFNRTTQRKVFGPITPQEWQARQALSALATVDLYYRLRGNDIMLSPTPSAGQTIAFEYIANTFCQSSGGAAQSAWAADSDTGRVSEELITLGIIWRFQTKNGLPQAAASYAKYLDERDKAASRQEAAPTLNAGMRRSQGYGWPNVPEVGFG